MFNYGDIIEYIDATYDENFNAARKWCKDNNATFDEIVDRRKENIIEKTRQVETYEEQEQVIPAEYDENGNIVKEEVKTTISIPVIKEEKYTETELHRFFQINKIPDLSLDELKPLKRAEINNARDKTEQGGFEYMGKVFDSDQVSCIRISSAAQAMQYAADDATITWTCQDNSTIELNKEQLSGLIVALAQWSNSCHQKATILKAQIDNCQSKEDLEKVIWE